MTVWCPCVVPTLACHMGPGEARTTYVAGFVTVTGTRASKSV
jgi:hypothetical protein